MAVEIPDTNIPNPKKPRKRKIPNYLIKETIDGTPFYYRGYRSVVNKTKTIEDIMPDSGLQSIIKNLLKTWLESVLDTSKYWVLIGEVGNHIDKRNNLGLDIAIYDKKILTIEKITNKYIDVSPDLVIEVDVNIEMENRSSDLFEEYIFKKIRRLHALGTKKIVWLFTKSKTVIVAHPNNNWQVSEWDMEVELLEGVFLNIPQYLEEQGLAL